MTAPTASPPVDDLDTLAATLTGRLLRPGDPDHQRLAAAWNLAATTHPLAVVEAADAEDVALAVRWAVGRDLAVDVRCTGHGAVTTTRPTLLVHTGLLDSLVIDPAGSARVGAGVRWQALLDAAAPYGLTGLAGSSPNVGVIGYLTGGGLGPLARTFGLASDRVVAFEVVTGDGVMRRATAEENPALYWGLRGGKGALGVVTAVEIELLPLSELFGGCVYFAASDAAAVLHRWRLWTQTLPDAATSSVAIVRLPPLPGVPEPLAGRTCLGLRFAWVGEPEQARQVLAPVLAAGTSVLGGFGVMPAAAIGAIHADPVAPTAAHETNTLLAELSPETVDRLLSLTGPDTDCHQVVVELRHLGGALRRTPAHPSAFAHREASYSLSTIGPAVPPLLEDSLANGAAVVEAVRPWSTGGCLPNSCASDDPHVLARRYPAETLSRLASLVTAYDPAGVLSAGRVVTEAHAHGSAGGGVR